MTNSSFLNGEVAVAVKQLVLVQQLQQYRMQGPRQRGLDGVKGKV